MGIESDVNGNMGRQSDVNGNMGIQSHVIRVNREWRQMASNGVTH